LFFTLLPHYEVLLHFIRLERKAQRRPIQILKNIYSNAHLLKSKVDWLHFGFATMALQSEHVAKAIGAKMAVSCRGFDMDVYPLKHPHCYTLLWQHVDKVHAISQYMLKKAYETGLSKQTPTQVITPAIAVSKFNAKPAKTAPSLPFRFVTIARLHWIKG